MSILDAALIGLRPRVLILHMSKDEQIFGDMCILWNRLSSPPVESKVKLNKGNDEIVDAKVVELYPRPVRGKASQRFDIKLQIL